MIGVRDVIRVRCPREGISAFIGRDTREPALSPCIHKKEIDFSQF